MIKLLEVNRHEHRNQRLSWLLTYPELALSTAVTQVSWLYLRLDKFSDSQGPMFLLIDSDAVDTDDLATNRRRWYPKPPSWSPSVAVELEEAINNRLDGL